MNFPEFDLHPDILRAIDQMGFEEPTQIQAQVIPEMLAGKDLIAQARTGTGKTAAFGIPIVQRIDPERTDIQALVLAPTRELAVQVAGEIGRIAQFLPVRVVPVYGGQPISRQLRLLQAGAQIVIGTPGRVLDHLRRGTVDFQQIQTLVLDEADEMLDLGFLEDVEAILRQTRPDRQTALFSATMPMAILRLTDRYMRSPERIQLARPRGLTVPETRQRYYVVPSERLKFEALCQILDATEIRAAIIFCATKRNVDNLAVALKGRGYDAEPIHGDLNQTQRDKVMRAFREHRTELLIATDVAARGLDIEGLSHVINFDMPQDTERYVHRIGRTGRIGATGEAMTIVTPWEIAEIEEIAGQTQSQIEATVLPVLTDSDEAEPPDPLDRLGQRLIEAARQGSGRLYRPLIERLAADHNPIDLAAAALALSGADTDTLPLATTPAADLRPTRSAAPRPPRPARPDRPPRTDRPPRADRPARADRPPRADRPAASVADAPDAAPAPTVAEAPDAAPPPARPRPSGPPRSGPPKRTPPAIRISDAGTDLAAFSKFARRGRRRR